LPLRGSSSTRKRTPNQITRAIPLPAIAAYSRRQIRSSGSNQITRGVTCFVTTRGHSESAMRSDRADIATAGYVSRRLACSSSMFCAVSAVPCIGFCTTGFCTGSARRAIPRACKSSPIAPIPPLIASAFAELRRAFAAARARGPLRDAAWLALERLDCAVELFGVPGSESARTACEAALLAAREALR
jgi:hypothetical protein